jgi:hypothetical protein
MATCNFVYNDGKKGVENRVWYLNIISVTMVLVSSLIAGTVNAPVEIGDEKFARWEKCALAGATEANNGCNQMLDADAGVRDAAMLVMERVFTLSLVLAILNGITLLIGAVAHKVYKVTALHFELQMVLAIVNLGLFAGLVGWMLPEEPLEAINNKQSVYLKGVNIYIAALVGLVFSALDFVVFNALRIFVFKNAGKCGVEQVAQLEREAELEQSSN